MAIQLHTLGQAAGASLDDKRWRSIACLSVVLTLLSLFFYSHSLGITVPPVHPQSLHSAHGVLDVSHGVDRPLIVFVYADTPNARENLKFFVKRGIHPGADFIFIFNGPSDAPALVPTHLENVQVVQRDNTCYDIGAIGEVLAKDNLWMKYKRFITMNASIRGPFVPVWSDDCWTDAFFRKITDEVKLVGLTYNCQPMPHVQSMLFATDQIGMSILIDPALAHSVMFDSQPYGGYEDPVGFSACYQDYTKAVRHTYLLSPWHHPKWENKTITAYTPLQVHSEIGMASLIRSQGYKVDVLLTSVHAYTPDEYCGIAGNPGDHLQPGQYYGSNVHPYEIIFAKANRGVEQTMLDLLTAWHYNMNDTSWERCGKYQ